MDITENIGRRIDMLMRHQDNARECMRRALWDTSVTFTAARRGGWGVQWQGKVLDSTYSPQKAASSFLKSFQHDGGKLVVLLGAGGGSLPVALAEKLCPAEIMLLVYEPNPSILLGLFTFNDDIDGLNPDCAQFVCEAEAARRFLFEHPAARDGFQVLCAPSYTHAMPEEIDAFRELCREAADLRATNRVTRVSMTRQWLRNLIINLPQRTKLPGFFDLAGSMTGLPAVLVGSGPSLDKNLETLRSHKEKTLIIASNSNLKALTRNGITPHLVFAVETADISRDLDPSDLVEKPALVLAETCNPACGRLPYPSIFLLPQAHLQYGAFMKEVTGEQTSGLGAGASVSNIMLQAALIMGCDPIAMIGQDLAYTDGKAYATATDYGGLQIEQQGGTARLVDQDKILTALLDDADRPNFQTEQQIHEVLSWDRKDTVTTSRGFDLIRYCFQEEAARVRTEGMVRLVNATEGGAFIEGFAHESLADFFQALPDEPAFTDRIAEEIERAWSEGSRLPKERLQDGLEQAKRAVARYAAGAEEALTRLELLAAVMKRGGADDPDFRKILDDYKLAERRIRPHGLVELWIEGDMLRLERKVRPDGLSGIFEKARQTLGLVIEGCSQVSKLLNAMVS
ncbi:MAG: DUF115 domain-containing protein [Acidobacteriota bacterium]|nr:DUF115 domain-containing protein [Acidobacteriota bacterium]